jgi:orotidine-5'-phosphate decarboxylase
VSFGRGSRVALDTHGPLCVGIDPHEALLRAWGLDASASGAREFGLRTVEAARVAWAS